MIKGDKDKVTIVIGRDGRKSGHMVAQLVISSLVALGIDVIDLEMAPTPTVEWAVTKFNADGGIILTASHNPKQWNALKLLNHKGEFINDQQGKKVLELAEKPIPFAQVDDLGIVTKKNVLEENIQYVNKTKWVNKKIITEKAYTVVVDGINSIGGIYIPELLKDLGVKTSLQ